MGRMLDWKDGEQELVLRGPIQHPIANAEHVWVPHLTPNEGNVIGDWVFRCPAIIIADRQRAIAFIVDVGDLGTSRTWLDYDHPKRTITIGSGYRSDGHVFFVREPTSRGSEARVHVLTSSKAEDIANPFGMVSRWCFRKWGREPTIEPPIAKYLEHVVRFAFSREEGWGESVWQDVSESMGAPVFIVHTKQHPSVPPNERTWREPRSIWNQAWFSTQRCANGLLRYARQIGSSDLEARARKMTAIALSAPQDERGLFPSVLRAHEDTWHWTSSDRRPESASPDACHVVDAAFTCRMLLEWHALTNDDRALAYVRAFAKGSIALQRPSGAFPGWIEPDGRIVPELAEGPESAVSAALLFELGEHEAALRCLPFLENVAREGRWEDFETYYSCARWGTPGARIARNGVFKQNTLSIFWTAEAFFQAWRVTKDRAHLAMARRCVDELSLYQAIWDPPFLPAPAYGGFGVMNGDAEWNDARQSLFAPLYLDLGTAMGDRELVLRGMHALRASFTMLYCPENPVLARAYEKRFPFFGKETFGFMMENQGHDPNEPIGTFTIFTWGNGSALAAAATVRDRFPEIARECGL